MRIVDVRCRIFGYSTSGPMDKFANPLRGWDSAPDASPYQFAEWLVVEVEADNGVTGIGNAALAPRLAAQIVAQMLAPSIVGHALFERERLWQRMYRSVVAFGRRGAGMAAVSAVDIAVWDAQARCLGIPVFDLLGGRKSECFPVYASRLYPSGDLDQLAEEAAMYRDQGFTMVKQRFLYGPGDGLAGLRKNVELVSAVRDAIGPDVDLAADAYMAWDLDYARRMLRELEPFGLRWVEEPLLPDDLHGYRELRKHSPIPIAAGEHEASLGGLYELITTGAVDVLQPDMNRIGGLTAGVKVCAIAEAAGIPVVPHAGQMHNYHMVAANPACPMAEYFPVSPTLSVGNEMPHLLFSGEPVASGGAIELGAAPGLGLAVMPRAPVYEVEEW